MLLKKIFEDGYVDKINQLLGAKIIDGDQEFKGHVPIESMINKLGYQIQEKPHLHPQILIKKQTVYFDRELPEGNRRFYLAQLLGEKVHQAAQTNHH